MGNLAYVGFSGHSSPQYWVNSDVLSTTGLVIDEYEITAAPCLVFTVPGIKLKISSLIMSNQESEHDVMVLHSLVGLLGLPNFLWLLAAVPPQLISAKSPGSGPLLPLPAGGAFGKELTPVLSVSSLPP